MPGLRPLEPTGYDAWLARARDRMVSLRAPGRADAAEIVDGLVARLLPDGLLSADQHVLAGADGELWFMAGADPVVLDLGGDPRVLLPAVHDAARRAGAGEMKVLAFPSQPDLAAATADLGYAPVATRMRRGELGQRPGDRDLMLQPMSTAAAVVFAENLVASYAADLLSNGSVTDPEAASATARRQTDEALAGPGSVVLAGFAAGEEVGTVWLDVDGDETFILDIVVTPEHRGRGFGRALMVAIEDHARERGCRSVALSVFGDNAVARGLYDSLGYQVTETFLRVGL